MFSDATVTKTGGNNYQVSYGDDRAVYAEFFKDAIIDNQKTAEQGRPIYRNVDMLRIMFPGDNTKEVVRIVRIEASGNQPADPDRFPRQWAAFQAQQEQIQDGTPIEQWPPISKAQALELKAMKIHTVEQLAAVTDTNLKWMGARQLRDNAIAWLSEAESGAETIKLQNRISELQAQLEAMANQMAGFATSQKIEAVVQSAEAAPVTEAVDPTIKPIATKMRGRPKKVADGTDIPTTNATSGE